MITLPGGKKEYADSTGKVIAIGDSILFRGNVYTLKAFGPNESVFGVATLIFEESTHTDEVPCECSVDKVT